MELALSLLLKYKYAVLLPLAILEGPIVSLVAGFLVSSGVLDPLLSFMILLFGDIIPDTIFYYIGYFGNKTGRIRAYFSRMHFFAEHGKIIEQLWMRHGLKTMFFGKLAYGFALPFLVSAGAIRLPFRKFISYAIPVTVFQYGIIMSVGYLLGSSYQMAQASIRDTYLIMALAVIVIITAYSAMTKYIRKKIVSLEEKEKNT